jgi:hypothetical protein
VKSINWRDAVNEILFGLTYTEEITDETVRWNAESAVHYTTLTLGSEVYHQAIIEALATGERLDSLRQLPQFDQAQIAGFLRALANRLEALRPWPEPKFRQLEVNRWTTFRDAVPIARLNASIRQVTDVLQRGFRPAGGAEPGMQVLMLKLATGEIVALLGSYGRGEGVTLLTDAGGDPAEVIEHFTAATGFPADEITTIRPNP